LSTRDFYRDLAPFHSFPDEVFAPEVYRALPRDWVLLIADIAGSTRAVEAGRYAEVNYLGAACIVAVNNALDGFVVPAVFGGDGATLAVPPEARDAALAALLATSRWGREAFDLELRVGVVPMSVLAEHGDEVAVAKLEFSPGNAMAMFRGSGLDAADRLIKADALGRDGYRLLDTESARGAPDLHTLSCRWAPLAAENGVMLCLIIAARAATLAQSDAIYREALAHIDAIAPLDSAATSPVKLSTLRMRLRIAAMRKEVSHEPGPAWRRWPRVFVRHLLQALVFWFNLEPGNFDPRRYRHEVTINADFRKVAGMLRLILDCSTAQADAIEAALEPMQRAGRIHFGAHRAGHAIMTCVTPDVDSGEHLHHIDGGDGGLYSAAKRLKARIAAAVPAGAPR
jgi:hypothetical protein